MKTLCWWLQSLQRHRNSFVPYYNCFVRSNLTTAGLYISFILVVLQTICWSVFLLCLRCYIVSFTIAKIINYKLPANFYISFLQINFTSAQNVLLCAIPTTLSTFLLSTFLLFYPFAFLLFLPFYFFTSLLFYVSLQNKINHIYYRQSKHIQIKWTNWPSESSPHLPWLAQCPPKPSSNL